MDDELETDILNDLHIAYAQHRQWWRVIAMKNSWLAINADPKTVERAYNKFKEKVSPFMTLPNPIFHIGNIALNKVRDDYFIATPMGNESPKDAPYEILREQESKHWLVTSKSLTAKSRYEFNTFDHALEFVRTHAWTPS